MSDGRLSITFADTSLEGTFANGRLVSGRITKPNTTYIGTFDENQQLHGDSCQENHYGAVSTGKFIHGEFVEGNIIHRDTLQMGTFHRRVLVRGLKIDGKIKFSGTFLNGYLSEGFIQFPNERHEGRFYRNKLCLGVIIADNYKANICFGDEQLTKCAVVYSGDLKNLNIVQFILLCCSGLYCKEAYQFYKSYLADFSIKKIINLSAVSADSFINVNSYVGYKQIMDNLKTYTDQTDLDIMPKPGPIDIFNYYVYRSHD